MPMVLPALRWGKANPSKPSLVDFILDRRNRFQVIRDGQGIFLGHVFVSVFDDLGHEPLNVVQVWLGAIDEHLHDTSPFPIANSCFFVRLNVRYGLTQGTDILPAPARYSDRFGA